MQTEAAYPPPPPGYKDAYRFRYPMAVLQLVSFVALLACIAVYGTIISRAQGVLFRYVEPINLIELLLILLTLFVTIVVHEIIHGVTYSLLGYRVSYGLSAKLGAAYAAAFGQFQKRTHNLIAALMPLLVITVIGVPLLTIPNNRPLMLIAFAALIMNTSGAVGDIYLSWWLLRLPLGTLLYDVSIDTSLIYEPAA